jgi:hypothetical protein
MLRTALAVHAVFFLAGIIASDAAAPAAQQVGPLHHSFRLYRCHTIMNRVRACPKGLDPEGNRADQGGNHRAAELVAAARPELVNGLAADKSQPDQALHIEARA